MTTLPDFYDPSRVGEVYVERAALVAERVEELRKRSGIAPAANDRVKVAAFGIDCQIGFATPGASLFVPGAVEDTQRTVAWIYRNLEKLTALHFSMDTHRVYQIFHPAFWVGEGERHPPPFTPVFHEDVKSGKWRPIAHEDECLEYTRKLEASGKYVLTIWPYHTLLGGVSHALVPALMEAAIFHAIARGQPTQFETKGMHPMTENYSVLSPEVRELGGKSVGAFNESLFRALMEYDRVYVFGQAKSHCVLSTLRDMQEHIQATDPSLMKKVFILDDAMSPVPPPPLNPLPPALDFPRVADRAMREFAAAGMNVVRTNDAV
jgi:nicotinamidase-related amidase